MKTKLSLYAVSLLAVTLLTGCEVLLIGAGAAAGVGGVAYVKGELVVAESVTLDKAWKATENAMKDLQFTVVKQNETGVDGMFEAQGAGDKKVVIKLKKTSDTVTEFRIRVGTFGDETVSRQVHAKIKAGF